MSTSGKRSHSRRSREYNVTEDSSEDSDSSVRSTEYDWRDEKTKEKRSHRRPDDDDRRRSSYKKERRSKRDKKGSKEKKRQKKRKKKGTPEILEGQDSDPLHQNKEPQAKQSCLAFISSTRLTPTAASHSVAGRELPSAAGDRAERMQQSSSNNVQGTQRSLAPMSKEEYERIRNTIRRVVDPETGRSRLIRGEGEVLEEIVSRDRHKEINKLATRGDGEWFLRGTGLNRQT